jgi:hypothetical protein
MQMWMAALPKSTAARATGRREWRAPSLAARPVTVAVQWSLTGHGRQALLEVLPNGGMR